MRTVLGFQGNYLRAPTMNPFPSIALLASLALTGCAHFHDTPASADSVLKVDAQIKITQDGSGVYDFKYDSPYSDADGNFDFSVGAAAKSSVQLTFEIADDSGLGIKFKPEGSDAIWIVDKKFVGPDGSPEGPFRGAQFRDFRTSADGRSLTLFNVNNDGILYRYGLRFDRGSETVIDDPDNQNGHGGSGGNN